MRERLADPSLLDRAVAVPGGNQSRFLAVPVGNGRRGGYVAVSTIMSALRVYATLRGRPGFPRLRIQWSPRRDTCHSVEWGEPPPNSDDIARGRFYGYSSEAINAFLAEQQHPPLLTHHYRDAIDLTEGLPVRLRDAIRAWSDRRRRPPAALSQPWDLLQTPGGPAGDQTVALLRKVTGRKGIGPLVECEGDLFWLIPSPAPPSWSAPGTTWHAVAHDATPEYGAQHRTEPQWSWVERPHGYAPETNCGRLPLLQAVLLVQSDTGKPRSKGSTRW